MKTLQELFAEIMASDEMKKAFAEAAKEGKVLDYIRANGCEATMEEVQTYLKEKADRELSEEELDSAAGGACNYTTGSEAIVSVISAGIACAASAIYSAAAGHVGQKDEDEGRLCTYT